MFPWAVSAPVTVKEAVASKKEHTGFRVGKNLMINFGH